LEPRQHAALKKATMRSNKRLAELMRQVTDDYLSEERVRQEDDILKALKNLK
jgi:hypothetical protein